MLIKTTTSLNFRILQDLAIQLQCSALVDNQHYINGYINYFGESSEWMNDKSVSKMMAHSSTKIKGR